MNLLWKYGVIPNFYSKCILTPFKLLSMLEFNFNIFNMGCHTLCTLHYAMKWLLLFFYFRCLYLLCRTRVEIESSLNCRSTTPLDDTWLLMDKSIILFSKELYLCLSPNKEITTPSSIWAYICKVFVFWCIIFDANAFGR